MKILNSPGWLIAASALFDEPAAEAANISALQAD